MGLIQSEFFNTMLVPFSVLISLIVGVVTLGAWSRNFWLKYSLYSKNKTSHRAKEKLELLEKLKNEHQFFIAWGLSRVMIIFSMLSLALIFGVMVDMYDVNNEKFAFGICLLIQYVLFFCLYLFSVHYSALLLDFLKYEKTKEILLSKIIKS